MEILFFLKERAKFIRHFYETAGEPFRETMRRIEEEEEPFDNPPYSENAAPPYLEEWMNAADGLEVLGRTSLSMLSPPLQLYFRTWESELGVRWGEGERKRAFSNGFLKGYQKCFSNVPGLSWDDCPADLELIEQITLARNCDQHQERITSIHVDHARKDLEKYPNPLFVSEAEHRMYADTEMQDVF